jgi:hypothetical protein
MKYKLIFASICLFVAPWLIGMLFDLVIYMHVPDPTQWDAFSRGFALMFSFFSQTLLAPIMLVNKI